MEYLPLAERPVLRGPTIDVRADVIAGNNHAVVGDLINAVLVRANAHGHLGCVSISTITGFATFG